MAYSSLKPNLGLYWYLFIEIFDFFRPLFATFLQLHSLFYVFPITIKFKYPCRLLFTLLCYSSEYAHTRRDTPPPLETTHSLRLFC